MEHLANHWKKRAEYMSRRYADPVHRNLEQAADKKTKTPQACRS